MECKRISPECEIVGSFLAYIWDRDEWLNYFVSGYPEGHEPKKIGKNLFVFKSDFQLMEMSDQFDLVNRWCGIGEPKNYDEEVKNMLSSDYIDLDPEDFEGDVWEGLLVEMQKEHKVVGHINPS